MSSIAEPSDLLQDRNRPKRHNRPPRAEGDTRTDSPMSARPTQQTAEGAAPRPPRKPRHPRPRNTPAEGAAGASTSGATSTNNSRPASPGDAPKGRPAGRVRTKRRNGPPGPATGATESGEGPSDTTQPPRGNRRGAKFGAGLTDTTTPAPQRPSDKYRTKPPPAPIADDLTSTLIHALRTPPYPDCPICFSAIHPAQPTWSCSPSIPTVVLDGEETQYCWTTFHMKCIRSWAGKSVKEVAEAWRARGEERKGDWRCPGCQSKRETVPSGYWCFCNSTPDPKPLRLATPHSCGGPCSRPRASGCGHACPLPCHPGPCPPCQVTTRLECYCPRKKVLAFRCGVEPKGKGREKAARNLSCGEPCGRVLACGKHTCAGVCHAGECAPCEVREKARCWCGKEEREVRCGEGREVQCFVEGETPWMGRFGCDNICDRSFDCGIHKCQKACHAPSPTPAPCPRSPSKITHCPCGKSTIAPTPSSPPSQYTFPARTSCTSPIPTCPSPCSKPHPACSHPCSAQCHTGPCPPCAVELVRPCRCGTTTHRVRCFEATEGEREILCDRPCAALRACGRHQCRRVCCPLASLAAGTGKKGRKQLRGLATGGVDEPGIGEERGGLHECDLVCGKMLSCGNHRCEERDHRGVCPPCLRSSFEELVCACGRTVLEPPIPCGTRIQCHYSCPRPLPPCGHPRTPHSCHEDTIACPPCPSLTMKQCACGKKTVPNVRCSLEREKVSCGTMCGKLMSCGFHHCEKLCHGGECGTCIAPCGKSRKLCLPNHHPCPLPCHAPSSCPETEPCQSLITVTCPCGRIRQSVHCGRSTSQPAGKEQPAPKCSTECNIAKRNARLAEALGIDTKDKAGGNITYHDELVAFARANAKFLPMVEKTFAEFVSSEKRTQVLPHMPPDRRKFVHDLASVYRMDAQMVDQEPHRSVQLLRRVDTRVPSPLLSTFIMSNPPPPSLGKLADLRSLKAPPSSSWRANASPSPKPFPPASAVASGSAQRGWASAISTTASASASVPKSAPHASGSSAGLDSRSNLTRTPTPVVSGDARRPPLVGSTASVVATPSTSEIPSDEPVPENWEDDV